jgi:hypothetical protein
MRNSIKAEKSALKDTFELPRYILLAFTITIFFHLCFIPSIIAQKSTCLAGNCKNGIGLRKVSSTTYPIPSPMNQTFNTVYHYYEIGEFSNAKLSGKGCRFSSLNLGEAEILNMFNSGKKFEPDNKNYFWFETGQYADGALNGSGLLIEYNTRNAKPATIQEGMFQKGYLNGNGIKIVPSNKFLSLTQDSASGKFSMLVGMQLIGNFKQGVCYDCTLTQKEFNNQEGVMKAFKISQHFINGWVLRDYESEPNTSLIKKVPLYKALYIGGYEITRLKTLESFAKIDTVDLLEGKKYIGEVDHFGKPYGFGVILFPGMYGIRYEGFVDNGVPNGYGYYESTNNEFQPFVGGNYVNNVWNGGAIFNPNTKKLDIVYKINEVPKPEYNFQHSSIISGGYTSIYFIYDEAGKIYLQNRIESGKLVNGKTLEVYVSLGQTNAEKRISRKITNNIISKSDLLIDDVIVQDGMASPVVKEIAGVFYLKNGKLVNYRTNYTVQLSKYPLSEFSTTCSVCSGSCTEAYIYQRPPEIVNSPRLEIETKAYDYTIWTTTKIVNHSYTKSFAPEKRTRLCTACNGKGKTKDILELPE